MGVLARAGQRGVSPLSGTGVGENLRHTWVPANQIYSMLITCATLRGGAIHYIALVCGTYNRT